MLNYHVTLCGQGCEILCVIYPSSSLLEAAEEWFRLPELGSHGVKEYGINYCQLW